MKLLMIGIDGGDQRILEGLSLVNFQKLFGRLHSTKITEDLWSRGWVEILTGKHGRETGAFYSKPLLDGSHKFSQRYSGNDYQQDPHVTPLWTKLMAEGHKIGFMNFPTTSPAPQLEEGSFVSGAGGGSATSGSASIPPEAVSHPSVASILEKIDYIADTRFCASGIRDAKVFFERLGEMQRRRTKAFVHLAKAHKIDVGCVAYRSVAIAQYLAMCDLEHLLAHGIETEVQAMIMDLYRDFDLQIARLLDELSPDKILLVSDHGMSPYQHTVHLKPFLIEIGMQTMPKSSYGSPGLKRTLKNILPHALRKRLRSAVPAMAEGLDGTDWNRTRAFGARYVNGIYINDNRFHGPVVGEDIAKLTDEIVVAFNQTDMANKYHLFARPYRRIFSEARFANMLPDIWIDHPDTVFFENYGPAVSTNDAYRPLDRSLSHVDRDQFTGIKGRTPLLHIERTHQQLIDPTDAKDLTLTYALVDRMLS